MFKTYTQLQVGKKRSLVKVTYKETKENEILMVDNHLINEWNRQGVL